MTDIPGTGKLSEEKEKENPPFETSVLNVDEIKKPKRERMEGEDKWYNQALYWGLFGALGGLVFVILGIFQVEFLYLSPVIPVAALVSWYIRRLIMRFGDEQDEIFK